MERVTRVFSQAEHGEEAEGFEGGFSVLYA